MDLDLSGNLGEIKSCLKERYGVVPYLFAMEILI